MHTKLWIFKPERVGLKDSYIVEYKYLSLTVVKRIERGIKRT
jgi:hypothetical protein